MSLPHSPDALQTSNEAEAQSGHSQPTLRPDDPQPLSSGADIIDKHNSQSVSDGEGVEQPSHDRVMENGVSLQTGGTTTTSYKAPGKLVDSDNDLERTNGGDESEEESSSSGRSSRLNDEDAILNNGDEVTSLGRSRPFSLPAFRGVSDFGTDFLNPRPISGDDLQPTPGLRNAIPDVNDGSKDLPTFPTSVLPQSKRPGISDDAQDLPVDFGLSTGDQTKRNKDDGSEISSDEDLERLDPAWGIKRTDSSQVLAQVHRSPSFPDFIPREEVTLERPVHVPVTQAESVLQELEDITGGYMPFKRDESDDDADDMKNPAERKSSLDAFRYGTETSISPDEHINEEFRAQRRFEEGVPLIHEELDLQEQDKSVLSPTPDQHMFGPSDDADDTSFFSRPHQTDHAEMRPPHLDRKDTVDVLQSLHYSPEDPPDSPLGESTSASQQGKIDDSSNETEMAFENAFKDDKDDDIAGMWEAALADEEFLVEDPDELLPDSAPGSPSSFLESLKAEGVSLEDPGSQALAFKSQNSREPEFDRADRRPDNTSYQRSNPVYSPHQPSTSDLTHLSSSTFGSMGISQPGVKSMNSMQQQFQRPALATKAESFVDQSKGGYKSPYDLPMELSKPRKRTQMQAPATSFQAFPPPPRSSSMTSEKPPMQAQAQLQSPFSPVTPAFPARGSSTSSQAPVPPLPRDSSTAAPTASARPAIGTFFEELPITARPRALPGSGRYTPQQMGSMLSPQSLQQSPPSVVHEPPSRPSPPSHPQTDPYAQYQLQRPERLDPYANVPLQTPAAPVNVSARYSPAPPVSQAAVRPTPSPRYSPAPPTQPINAPAVSRYASQPATATQPSQRQSPPSNRYASQPTSAPVPVPAVHPFQPRTSSPLAYFGRRAEDHQQQPATPSSDQYSAPIHHSTAYQMQSPPSTILSPPRRSQTQSPGKGEPASRVLISPQNIQRPASIHGQMSPAKASNLTNIYEFVPPTRSSVRQRGLSQNLSFIQPTDGQEHDELQRWKGSPIFRFGFGGSAVSSFPKHIPRYSAGSTLPMYKPSAGEVHFNNIKEVSPLPDDVAKFPGPLRSKSKKKDVLSWLSAKIASLEQAQVVHSTQAQLPDPRKRNDEKVLLWKTMKVLVEHDGMLEGTLEVRQAINLVLSPEAHVLDDASATQYGVGADVAGIYRPAGSSVVSEPVDPVAVETLRKNLLRGDRDKAVWAAVDSRLWAHALLISSTLDRAIWKQVVQEFVRQEVKMIGANTESLAALYEVFAGNLDESIDELVPPSARAGLQMVSKTSSTGPTKNALDGLDRWRETLSLILNNRSDNDQQALAALGGLLSNYGRIEAAHLCYLFSRSPSRPTVFGGADDPNANIVLLGADHRAHPFNFYQDDDAVLLTEVYEFATSVLPSTSTMVAMPHLQAYKLQRAIVLAEIGYNTESLAYCDAIAALSRSTTKVSSYYSPQFHAELDELSRRLKQAPVENSSWIAKPSIEKVSGTLWNKFTGFVAGEDSDAESKGSGKDPNHESGPFANVSGTPSLSRTGSTTDLYGSYPGGASQSMPNTLAGSRYAPGAQHASGSVSEFQQTRSSLDSQRSPPFVSSNLMQSQSFTDQASSFGSQSYLPTGSSSHQKVGPKPALSRYQSTPPQTSYMPNNTLGDSPQSSYNPQQPKSYVPTPPPESFVPSYQPAASQNDSNDDPVPLFGGYTPSPQPELEQPGFSTEPPTQSYGYEPPSDTGYVPYEPDPDSETEASTKRTDPVRKTSFMNDVDDSSGVPPASAFSPPTASQLTPSSDAAATKRANDAAADAAFRAAAEADAQRDSNNKDSSKTVKHRGSSWFGGWLGGKKDGSDSLDDNSAATSKSGDNTKVIRAKLGEESAFYYDQDLKKWVNKKNPEMMQAGGKAAPPPPKGMGKGLTPSASMPVLQAGPPMGGGPSPGSGPPSRVGTPSEGGEMGPPMATFGPLRMASGGSTPPIGSMGLAPPSRPGTGMSSASSLDDLMGPPTSGAGRRTVRGKKGGKGRYVDLVAATQQAESSS